MNRDDHLLLLRRCIEISESSKRNGNTPFGALLADDQGRILLEQENIEITESNCTGHAETTLMEAASKKYSRDFLWNCTLYTSVEPCAMCSGSIYWGNVGKVVYGLPEKRLLELTGNHEQNPTLDIPCREIFSRSQKNIEVIGPFEELEQEIIAVHEGYWN
ncbi:nucleoside deaminase [Paenibacillus caui]|uniref:nucleoside deaminase n=1 Tax=Paenibacillus caui TaxID=2873927 RepID=UPI001CA9EC1A|nr:nucleoside deaminase [Paenibacillus caui]